MMRLALRRAIDDGRILEPDDLAMGRRTAQPQYDGAFSGLLRVSHVEAAEP
ncbi:hypothetical protein D3C72_2499840 [compost metagenome]